MTASFYLLLFSVFVISSNGDVRDYPHMLTQALEKSTGVSEKCMKQLYSITSNKNKDNFWRMLDASAKFPFAGELYSSGVQYGNYDECLDIDYEDAEAGRVLGKYCHAGVIIPYAVLAILGIPVSDFGYNIQTDGMALSICVPDGCEQNDLLEVVSLIPSTIIEPILYNLTSNFTNFGLCTTKETGTKFKTEDIVVTTVIGLIGLLMIASTVFDVFLYLQDKKTPHPILTAFSVYSNGKKLIHIPKTRSKDQLYVFHGIKFISMMWIIAGHGFVGWLSFAVINKQLVDSWLTLRYAQYITTSPLAVDTFFFISGFLLAYGYLKSNVPQKLSTQLKQVPYMYLHRYLRLTPAILMIYLVSISIYTHLGSGPIYHSGSTGLAEDCKKRWWPFFLYIQNYYNYDNLCLTQTWYLSADMQMFVFAPIVLIPLSFYIRKNFKLAMAGLTLLNVVAVAIPVIVKLIWKDYGAANAYDTHSRLCNYTIGLTLGAFMRVKMDSRFPFKKWQNFLMWILALGEMLAVILVYQQILMYKTYERQAIYESFMRPLWCLGLCWIVYSSYHGQGGIVNWFLGCSLFQVGGRLTYCMYVVHGSIVAYIILINRIPQYFSNYGAFYFWCGHFMITLVISTCWTLAFESPMIIIEKLVFGGGAPKKPVVPKTEEEGKPTA